ncbi:MAG: hypothetical protein HY812_21170 [Planctomycetes bacterium]|nr:hypothetical protein [Planctomycetota bacterium]
MTCAVLFLLAVLAVADPAQRDEPLDGLCARFSGLDQDGDGAAEIERLALLGGEAPAGEGPLVLALVEGRVLDAGGGAVQASLERWRADLAAEGFRAALVRAGLYAGERHQDGLTLLALREFLRAVRDADPSLAGAVLVGAFPEAYLVRTVNWRKLCPLALNRGTEREKVFAEPIDFLSTVPEGVAHTCDLVLGDLDGRWERLYTQPRERLPYWHAVFPGGVPAGGGVAADFERGGLVYEDFFHANDGVLEVREVLDEQGNVAALHVIPLDEARDAECCAADRERGNRIARPDVLVSRVNARGVASDLEQEIRLLLEFFERNHLYRTGELDPVFPPASLSHGLGSGYGVLKEAAQEWAALAEPELDVQGAPGLAEAVAWLKRPAVLRTIRAHSDRCGSSLERGERLDCNALRALWSDGALPDGASFYLHTGCEAISPAAAETLPYSDPAYGRDNSAAGLLFFARGLALVGRAKVFYEEPRGFCPALAEGATFGAAWARYFEIESQAASWPEVGDDIGRKRSYFWSVLGDWTLRLRRPR